MFSFLFSLLCTCCLVFIFERSIPHTRLGSTIPFITFKGFSSNGFIFSKEKLIDLLLLFRFITVIVTTFITAVKKIFSATVAIIEYP